MKPPTTELLDTLELPKTRILFETKIPLPEPLAVILPLDINSPLLVKPNVVFVKYT